MMPQVGPERMRFWHLGEADTQQHAYWLEIGPYVVALDCGTLAGWQQVGRSPDLLVVSHAHPEQSGAIATFRRWWPQVPIVASEETAALVKLAQAVAPEEGIPEPEGSEPWQILATSAAMSPLPGLELRLIPAGHLPGARLVQLGWEGHAVVYTGDWALSSSRLTAGLSLEGTDLLSPDVLVIAGPLGAKRYPARRRTEAALVSQIQAAIAQQHTLLVPVPTLGLGQELLLLLKTHHAFTQLSSPLAVWVDEPVATGCDHLAALLPSLPAGVQNFARHQALFWQTQTQPRVQRRSPTLDWEPICQFPGIILVAADNSFEAWGSLWGSLRPAMTTLLAFPEVTLTVPWSQWPQVLQAHMTRVESEWHSHGDRQALTQVVHTLRPDHLILVPGDSSADLAQLPEFRNRYHVHAPAPGHDLDLILGGLQATLPALAPPPTQYEGELEEIITPGTGITSIELRLPGAIADHPLWQQLADTGVVTAQWEGDALVIRRLSSHELRHPPAQGHPAPTEGIPQCSTCLFQQQGWCGQPYSPMYQHQVPLSASCGEFVAAAAVS